jgi:hypothetical protein
MVAALAMISVTYYASSFQSENINVTDSSLPLASVSYIIDILCGMPGSHWSRVTGGAPDIHLSQDTYASGA